MEITQKLIPSVLKFFPLTNLSFFSLLNFCFAGYSFCRGDINIFIQPLFRHFDSAMRFEYYLYKHFRFCIQLFSWIMLSLEHNNFDCLWQNKKIHRSNLSKICKICFKTWARRGFQPKISRYYCQSFLH